MQPRLPKQIILLYRLPSKEKFRMYSDALREDGQTDSTVRVQCQCANQRDAFWGTGRDPQIGQPWTEQNSI